MIGRLLVFSALLALTLAKAIVTNHCPYNIYIWSIPQVLGTSHTDSLPIKPGGRYEERWRHGSTASPGIAIKVSPLADGIHKLADEINFAYTVDHVDDHKIWVDLSPVRGKPFEGRLGFHTCKEQYFSTEVQSHPCGATDNIELVLCDNCRTTPVKDNAPFDTIQECYDYPHHDASEESEESEDPKASSDCDCGRNCDCGCGFDGDTDDDSGYSDLANPTTTVTQPPSKQSTIHYSTEVSVESNQTEAPMPPLPEPTLVYDTTTVTDSECPEYTMTVTEPYMPPEPSTEQQLPSMPSTTDYPNNTPPIQTTPKPSTSHFCTHKTLTVSSTEEPTTSSIRYFTPPDMPPGSPHEGPFTGSVRYFTPPDMPPSLTPESSIGSTRYLTPPAARNYDETPVMSPCLAKIFYPERRAVRRVLPRNTAPKIPSVVAKHHHEPSSLCEIVRMYHLGFESCDEKVMKKHARELYPHLCEPGYEHQAVLMDFTCEEIKEELKKLYSDVDVEVIGASRSLFQHSASQPAIRASKYRICVLPWCQVFDGMDCSVLAGRLEDWANDQGADIDFTSDQDVCGTSAKVPRAPFATQCECEDCEYCVHVNGNCCCLDGGSNSPCPPLSACDDECNVCINGRCFDFWLPQEDNSTTQASQYVSEGIQDLLPPSASTNSTVCLQWFCDAIPHLSCPEVYDILKARFGDIEAYLTDNENCPSLVAQIYNEHPGFRIESLCHSLELNDEDCQVLRSRIDAGYLVNILEGNDEVRD